MEDYDRFYDDIPNKLDAALDAMITAGITTIEIVEHLQRVIFLFNDCIYYLKPSQVRAL